MRHEPVLLNEVLEYLRPSRPDGTLVDATVGLGGHAEALLERYPAVRLVAIDRDPEALERSKERLSRFGDRVMFVRGRHESLIDILKQSNIESVSGLLADLGVSSMQLDNPDRGFTYKESGPLDMRMNPSRGEPASRLLAHLSVEKLARLLEDNADEPHASLIAGLLKQPPMTTTEDLCRSISRGITQALPRAGKREVEASIRRTFQALRIAVNDEFSALDALLRQLPFCLAAGGRVAILTFHSGEDRRVKKALEAGLLDGVYSAIADDVIRPSRDEMRSNPRAASAKLRWAVRRD